MNIKFTVTFLILLMGLPMMLSGADTTVIAKVGDNEVRADDIKPFIEKLPMKDQLILSKDPAAMNDFVKGIIIQQLVYKEAISKKWEQQPQIASQLERVRQQAITQSYLQSVATPPADFPSQADLQSAYEALKKDGALMVPKQYHLAQIYIACPNSADKQPDTKALAVADAACKEARSGDFAAVAKAQSNDGASAPRGGDLGYLAENQIQPEIRKALAPISKGGVSEPIRLMDGWHIVKVIDIKEPYTATLDEVKSLLTNELRSQRAQALGKAYLAKLVQQYPVTLNEIAVSKLINDKGN